MKGSLSGSKRKIEKELLKDINERRALQLAQRTQNMELTHVTHGDVSRKVSSELPVEVVYADNSPVWRKKRKPFLLYFNFWYFFR
ncbi:hypothetical protein M0Q50_00035 [bacterium]|jgi:hypothetical protein|nr:hypothetical protein [bacterium]